MCHIRPGAYEQWLGDQVRLPHPLGLQHPLLLVFQPYRQDLQDLQVPDCP